MNALYRGIAIFLCAGFSVLSGSCAQFNAEGSALGFLVLSGNSGGGGAGGASDWWDTAWSSRRTLRLDNSTRTENLDDFPVLVKLNSTRIDYSKTSAAGEDLRFIDADNSTQLAHEIELWDSAGDSFVWVKVPRIDAASSSDFIYLYYGNSAAADGQSASTVWSSSYAGVWHFGETVTDEATTGSHADSSGNNNSGAQNGNVNGTAQIGAGQTFDGNDNVCVPHSTSINLTGAMTLSLWFNPTGSQSTYNVFMDKAVATSYAIAYGNTAETYAAGLNAALLFDNTGTISISTWQHAALTYNATGDYNLYVNGVSIANGTNLIAITGNTDQLCFASSNVAARFFTGSLDELRIAGTARSADWISAQYASQNDTLVTYGAEESQ